MAAKYITSKERHLFIEAMLSKLDAISVDEIIASRIPLKSNGRHLMGLCPFHNDLHYGSFIVTPSKGLWKCFACGDGYGGNGIRFLSLYDNVDYLQAAFKAALEHGIITLEEYELYSEKQTYSKTYVSSLEKKHEKKRTTAEPQMERANFAIRHNVYHAFKDACTLSAEHRDHLLTKRKLTVERITADYFSFPVTSYEKNRVLKHIRDQYPEYTDEILITVPGFYYDKRYNKVTFYAVPGIGILIHDAHGRVSSIQIRRDTLKDGQKKYIWFSSSFAAYEPEKYLGGSGLDAYRDILYPDNEFRPILCITEGRFKSEVIRAAGNVAMSLQGVGAQNGIIKDIEAIMETRPIKTIYLMFDADMLGKFEVFRQLQKLYTTLSSTFMVSIKAACWHSDAGKGIDDLYNNGNITSIQYVNLQWLIETYKIVFANTLHTFGYNSLRDIPKTPAKKEEFERILQQEEENAIISDE